MGPKIFEKKILKLKFFFTDVTPEHTRNRQNIGEELTEVMAIRARANGKIGKQLKIHLKQTIFSLQTVAFWVWTIEEEGCN